MINNIPYFKFEGILLHPAKYRKDLYNEFFALVGEITNLNERNKRAKNKLDKDKYLRIVLNKLFAYEEFRKDFLFGCILHQNLKMFDYIINFGGINHKWRYNGLTPLGYAVSVNNYKMCELLVENGGIIDHKHILYISPYNLAKKNRRMDIINYFDKELQKK